MRVLYLTVGAEIGGGSVSLMTLMDRLRDEGVRSTVICPRQGPLIDKYREIGVDCHVMPYDWLDRRRPVATGRIGLRWRSLLQQIGPDIVHANAMGAARSVGLPTRSLGIPWICHCRFPEERQYVKWLFRWLPKPDAFVSCSQALHALMTDSFSEVSPGVWQEVIYDAVDLERFRPRAKPADTPLRVGIIANLTPIKGHEVFLEMAKLLVDGGVAAEFWLVGRDKDCGDVVRGLAQSLGLDGHVRFLGYQSDIPAVINSLDVVVSSSHMECCPVNVIEAMACGRPVVVTRVGGSPELVDEGRTGLVVPPRDPVAMADAVGRLLNDEALRREMGQAGRARAEQRFSREIYAHRVLDLYDRVLAQN